MWPKPQKLRMLNQLLVLKNNGVWNMSRAKNSNYKVYFRRRREGATNYAKRLALVKSGSTRMVVRKTNRNIIIQFVNFESEGDKTVFSFVSSKLKDICGWPAKRNIYTAYLAGLYAGKQAKSKNVTSFIVDFGMHAPTKGSVLFAALKGAVDAGLKTNYSEEKIPSDKLSNVPSELKSSFEDAKKKFAG